MAKNWIQIDTIYSSSTSDPKTRAERERASKAYKKLMAKTPTLKVPEIKKQSIELYYKQKEKEDSLLKAFEDKKLKSEKAIKQAIRIKKERIKKQNDAKQNTEKASDNENEATESSV